MTGTPSVIESVRGKTGQQNSKTARRKSAAQRETGEELEQHRVKKTHWAPNVTLELTWVNSVPCVVGSTTE